MHQLCSFPHLRKGLLLQRQHTSRGGLNSMLSGVGSTAHFQGWAQQRASRGGLNRESGQSGTAHWFRSEKVGSSRGGLNRESGAHKAYLHDYVHTPTH